MRIGRHQMFMGIARVASMRSTCYRNAVGAVIVSHRRILGIGYNGAPASKPHCTGPGCPYLTPNGCQVLHAERNAISQCNDRLDECRIYVTHSPCNDCAMAISRENIKQVYYEQEYRLTEPIQLLLDRDIAVFRVLPSGYIISQRNKEMFEDR